MLEATLPVFSVVVEATLPASFLDLAELSGESMLDVDDSLDLGRDFPPAERPDLGVLMPLNRLEAPLTRRLCEKGLCR